MSNVVHAEGGEDSSSQPAINADESVKNSQIELNAIKQENLEKTPVKNGEPASLGTPMKKKEMSASRKKDYWDDEDLTPEQKEEKKMRHQKANVKAKEMISGIFRKHRCHIVSVILMSIIGMSAELVSPLFVGYIIDAIISTDRDKIDNLITIWMIVTVSSSIVNGIQGYLGQMLAQKVGYELRQEYYEKLMHMDIEFFDDNKTGKLMSRLQEDCNKLEQAISTQLSLVIKSGLFCVVVVVIIFSISWRMTLFMLAFMFPICVYAACIGTKMRKIAKDISDAIAQASNVAQETFGNIRCVKAFGTEDWMTHMHEEKLANILKIERCKATLSGIHEFVMTGVMFGCMDALIYYSSWLYFNYNFTIGQLNAFNSYMFSFLINMAMLGATITEVMSMQGTMCAIADIMLQIPKVLIDGGEQVSTESLSDGSIRLDSIKFTYPTKKEIQVLQGVSIDVKKDKTVALVGSSGCGKSTIIQLVERFYDPLEGSTNYGKQDLKNLNPQSYKSNVAIVQQEPILFSGTIKDNIMYGLDKDPSQEDIEHAAKQANVHDFVSEKERFPDGYDTVVGERGVKLSGGQKQRIAIARALIRKPKVLLLDEATSALDAESEHQVQMALDNILANPDLTQTVIVIAHRLSTVQNADKIIVINKGVIAEEGTHQELLSSKGVYSKLVARQLAHIDVGFDGKDPQDEPKKKVSNEIVEEGDVTGVKEDMEDGN